MNTTVRVRKISSDKALVIIDRLRSELRSYKANQKAAGKRLGTFFSSTDKIFRRDLFNDWKYAAGTFERNLCMKEIEAYEHDATYRQRCEVRVKERDERTLKKVADIRKLFDFRKKQDKEELKKQCEKIAYRK